MIHSNHLVRTNRMSKKKVHAYLLLVDRPNGWRIQPTKDLLQNLEDYLRTDLQLPSVYVTKGTLVEYDPLCVPVDISGKSINVISLDDHHIKVSVLMKELMPIESSHYDLLLPLEPFKRFDLVCNTKWRPILDVKVGDTVWYYRSTKAASVAAKSRINGNFGHVSNACNEKDVGFVRYVGPLRNKVGSWIGVELFLDPDRGNSNGTHASQQYFEADDSSSVFTVINHLFIYDEDEDAEQIRQKIGIKRNSIAGGHQRKSSIMRQFELDRQNNEEQSEKILSGNNFFFWKCQLTFSRRMP